MRYRRLYILLLFIPLLHACKENDFKDLLDRQAEQQKELLALNEMCRTINEDIRALQLIVEAGKDGNYITGVQELPDGSGYVVSFSESNPITIRHGKKGETGEPGLPGHDGVDGQDGSNGADGNNGVDGSDGQNGQDGQDGTDGKDGADGEKGETGDAGDAGDSPVVGIVQDPADMEYYWTVKVGTGPAEYLKDKDGNRIKAKSATQDGLTPQVGVKQWTVAEGGDDNYYWTQKIGTEPEEWMLCEGVKVRANAKSEVSVFKKVEYGNPEYVEFILQNGSQFRVPREKPSIRIEGASGSLFFRRGETCAVPVKWTGIEEEQLTVIAPKGWNVAVDFPGGLLKVTAPEVSDVSASLCGTIRLRGGGTIEASLAVTLLQRMAVPDFKGSYVYNVTLEGIKVAEICQEYLPGYTGSERATVIYPYSLRDHKYEDGLVVDNGGSVKHDATGYVAGDKAAAIYLYTENGKMFLMADTLSGKDMNFGDGLRPEVMTDAEGNTYRMVKIGTQYWMADNLRTRLYPDGTPIATGLAGNDWEKSGMITGNGACAVYGYNNANDPLAVVTKNTFGLLYNYNAAEKAIPAGWGLPSEGELRKMFLFLGGADKAALYLKETGNDGWQSVSAGVTNLSGFSARGGGFRMKDGTGYRDQRVQGYWWSGSSQEDVYFVFALSASGQKASVISGENNSRGYSVRYLRK